MPPWGDSLPPGQFNHLVGDVAIVGCLIEDTIDPLNNPIDSATVTISIQRVSDEYYLNFIQGEFDDLGPSAQHLQSCTYNGNGYYIYNFNPLNFNETIPQSYLLTFTTDYFGNEQTDTEIHNFFGEP